MNLLEKLVGIAFISSLTMSLHYGCKLIEQNQSEEIEYTQQDKIRTEKNFVVPPISINPFVKIKGGIIPYGRVNSGQGPITLATYNGTNYLFKVAANGIPYFEPIMD